MVFNLRRSKIDRIVNKLLQNSSPNKIVLFLISGSLGIGAIFLGTISIKAGWLAIDIVNSRAKINIFGIVYLIVLVVLGAASYYLSLWFRVFDSVLIEDIKRGLFNG